MKMKRQSKIIELVNSQVIETQEELADLLIEEGFTVTQATISRDIRDLRLTKIATKDKKQKYVVLPTESKRLNEKLIGVFRNAYISSEPAGNIVVMKTLTGMAMAVGSSIDAMNNENIVGSIAGDDTLFCATRSEEEAAQLQIWFQDLARTNEMP